MAWQPPTKYGDITVTAAKAWLDEYHHGYAELLFEIANASATTPHRVTVTVPHEQFGGGNILRAATRAVDVPPGAKVTASIWLPPLTANGGGARIAIDGVTQDAPTLCPLPMFQSRNRYHFGRGHAEFVPRLLMDNDLSAEELTTAAAKAVLESQATKPVAGTGATAAPEIPVHATRAGSPLANRSVDNWLSFSSFDGVMLRSESWRRLPAPTRAALEGYVRVGGLLLLVGPFEPPPHWPESFAPTPARGCRLFEVGFGRCLVAERADTRRWTNEAWTMVLRHLRQSVIPFERVRDPLAAHQAFPVVAELEQSWTGAIVLLALFTLLAGPLNIAWLARIDRRAWMLWTVPVLALAVSAMIVVYATLREGIGGYLRMAAVTHLDENTQSAATIGWTGCYTPIGRGDGLRFAINTELTPQFVDDYRQRGQPRAVAWSGEQHLTTGWLAPRVPIHFQTRKFENRRERLVLRQTENATRVVNGLGAKIRQLTLRDHAGALWLGTDIAAGAEATLTKAPDDSRPIDKPVHAIYLDRWNTAPDGFAVNLSDWASKPGIYVAELDNAPFHEDGMNWLQSRRVESTVIGVLRTAADDAKEAADAR